MNSFKCEFIGVIQEYFIPYRITVIHPYEKRVFENEILRNLPSNLKNKKFKITMEEISEKEEK